MELQMHEAAAMMGGEILSGDPAAVVRGASLDSRKAKEGEFFFALPGKRTDGHRFVDTALAAGAAAVVEERFLRQDPEARQRWTDTGAVLQVEDGLAALHRLTRAVRRRTPEKLVGITGSAGKTTTKEILSSLLATKFRVAKSPGNLNSLYGFPLALMGIPDDTQWMVAEMGMSEPRELAQLARLARPDVAILTNVGPAHLEFFGSLRAIAKAKAELLEGLVDGGLVIANGDDPEVRWLVERYRSTSAPGKRRVVYYGRHAVDASVRAENVVPGKAGLGSVFDLVVGSERQAIELPLHGTYNVDNFLAAAACATSLGIPLGAIGEAAADLETASGRGRLHDLPGGGALVDDSYNSNPNAALRALESAAALSGTRHWTILGDMLELGPTAPELHRQVGASAARLGFSPVVGVGHLSRHLVEAAKSEGAENARWFEDATAAAEWAAGALRPGDVVLVKGSRGVALDRVVESLLIASGARPSHEGQC